REDGPYDRLIGAKLFGGGAEEAAVEYLKLVLDRPLRLARNEPLHQGHKLFRALCRRGLHEAWSIAELVRQLLEAAMFPGGNPPGGFVGAAAGGPQSNPDVLPGGKTPEVGPIARADSPEDFAYVSERLRVLRQDISSGNPSEGTRKKLGPLYLTVNN